MPQNIEKILQALKKGLLEIFGDWLGAESEMPFMLNVRRDAVAV